MEASEPATVTLTLDEVRSLAFGALVGSGTSEANARVVAESIVEAEADGIHSHGLARLPHYCEHVRCGKVDGRAVPACERVGPAALRADARAGFAHPAIALGLGRLIPLARENGIAALAVVNSYNCGVVGRHVERLAEAGLVGLAFANAPAAIAPWGGARALFGTNPVACAAPRKGAPPVIVDQASSVVARSEILLRAERGEAIPLGWGFDREGRPTTDAQAVLDGGALAPAGGYKGTGLALIGEILAAAVAGAAFSFEASSLADNAGGPPRIGQFFLALDGARLAGPGFVERLEALFRAMAAEDGVRLPGDRRQAARARAAAVGITVRRALQERLAGYFAS
jgi:(2R)-3-sulfolactate dehydrogenase (NADP+)